MIRRRFGIRWLVNICLVDVVGFVLLSISSKHLISLGQAMPLARHLLHALLPVLSPRSLIHVGTIATRYNPQWTEIVPGAIPSDRVSHLHRAAGLLHLTNVSFVSNMIKRSLTPKKVSRNIICPSCQMQRLLNRSVPTSSPLLSVAFAKLNEANKDSRND